MRRFGPSGDLGVENLVAVVVALREGVWRVVEGAGGAVAAAKGAGFGGGFLIIWFKRMYPLVNLVRNVGNRLSFFIR